MFSIRDINFSNGVYGSNGRMNGLEVHIMNSSEKADTVINDFEKRFSAGMDPNFLINQIFQDRHISESDFTESDINRINRKINAIYKTVNCGR